MLESNVQRANDKTTHIKITKNTRRKIKYNKLVNAVHFCVVCKLNVILERLSHNKKSKQNIKKLKTTNETK